MSRWSAADLLRHQQKSAEQGVGARPLRSRLFGAREDRVVPNELRVSDTMSLRRWNPKRDAAEPAIVDALEAIGVTVHRLSHPGLPDLLCWTRREGIRLIEVKTATGTLTEAQKATVCSSLPFCIVRSVPEALALYGVTA